MSAFDDANQGQHFAYFGTNQHVYQADWIPGSGYGYADATAGASAPVGSALSTFVDPSSSPVAGGEH